MIKRIILFSVFLGLFFYPSVSQAQWMSRNVSFKISLADFLYQYGKEVYNRGIDMREASFVFQRALVLNCHHEGAQTYLNKLHRKYPDVSIRIWGCSEEDDETIVSETIDASTNVELIDEEDGNVEFEKRQALLGQGFQVVDDEVADLVKGQLKDRTQNLGHQISSLEEESKQKDVQINSYKKKLNAEKLAVDTKVADDVLFFSIAQNQKDLIRVQQSNIDYLKSELADLKKQVQSGSVDSADTQHVKTQRQVADSGLETEEAKIKLVSKDQEVQSLQQKLEGLEEELKLVQKIIEEKNKMIVSLQESTRQ